MLKLGIAAGGAALLPQGKVIAKRSQDNKTSSSSSSISFTPFEQELYVPPILQPKQTGALSPPPGNYPGVRFGGRSGGPRAPEGDFDFVAHGIAPEFDTADPHIKEYKLITEEKTQEIIKGVETPVFVYRDDFNPSDTGMSPGPTVVSRLGEAAVIRNCNALTRNRGPVNTTGHDHETSVHWHGIHAPAHADGYPNFYCLAGEARDYYLPNIAPEVIGGGATDTAWIPSTLWYHDHAMDVTGFNVCQGLAGFYLVFDERELELITSRVLPPPGKAALESLGGFSESDINGLLQGSDEGFDFGLALTDQKFNEDGRTLFYDFLDHVGRIGDVFTVNGRVQPYFNVKKAKYRFRILNASNARNYQLRLSTGQPFIVFGADSWLFPRAGAVHNFELSMGQRYDVIVDFSGYPAGTEVFLENIMIQEDGRKGKEVDPDEPTKLLKFVVGSETAPFNITIEDDTVIRGFAASGGQWAPIRKDEIVRTRKFEFDRSSGAWTVNNKFFNPRRADAVPELDTAERIYFENGSGGWWHPIHVHLEGFQIQKLDGKAPPFERSFNSDLVNLHGGEEAEVFMKFRTFTGPFVFHCHNIEHEDMRMMGAYDPQPAGTDSPLDGVSEIDPAVSGVVPTCEELEADKRLFFNEAGDLDRVEGEGVGFPNCEFEPSE